MKRALVPVVLALAVGTGSAAGAQGGDPPSLTIPRVSDPPVLGEFIQMQVPDAPHGMRRVEGFVQRFPNDGEPVTERTVVYVGYDSENLYVVFLCFDREPSKIGAHLVGRDLLPNDEDGVASVLERLSGRA